MKTYLVTGATGALGSAVVARLLSDSQLRVLALVRRKATDAPAARLHAAITALGVNERVARDQERLRAIAGDVAQPRLGLSDADYHVLEKSCTHIIHCAGAVRMNLPLQAARQAAVDSARNILQLAEGAAQSGQLAKVELVSTVGVAGRDHAVLREDWVDARRRAFHNTYEQAKAEAEQLAHKAVQAGLPLSVHRPSMVIGDSRTGRALHFQVFYYLVEFLSGRRTLGIFPRLGNALLDVVPVDFVAEAIVRSSECDATRGQILHLCAGPRGAIRLRRLHTLVRDYLGLRGLPTREPRYVPRVVFRLSMSLLHAFANDTSRKALATLPLFLDYLDTGQSFDNTGTALWLDKNRISLPAVEEYLPRVLDFYFASARHRPEREASAETAAPGG